MIVLLAACAAVAAAVEDVPPLTVVSGANGRYALKELAVLLDIKDRARQENLPVRLIAYNLGQLGECADGDAGKPAPSSLWDSFGIEYRHFDFRRYPPHVAQLHCYAWKAPIIMEVAEEVKNASVVMWIDSGATVAQPLRNVVAKTRANGGYVSDETAKGLARFLHEKVLDYFVAHYGLGASLVAEIVEKRKVGGAALDDHEAFSDDLKRFRNCNGAFSAHVWGSPMFEKISKNWLACSLVKDCTCPPGSTRANHRQDQAALTLFSLMNGYVCGSHGKFVAAHGLRNSQLILEHHGVHSAKQLSDHQIFCHANTTIK